MDALVDTSVLVDMHRNHRPAMQWAKTSSNLTLGITPIVWMEMMEGAQNKLDLKQTTKLLTRFPLIYFTKADIDWAMKQLYTYKLSHGVGMMDCLVAAPAQRLQLPLYTINLKHMTPILGALAQKPY